ncbi:MAG: histidine kinase [Candidatus Hydrogenedentota bacterium]
MGLFQYLTPAVYGMLVVVWGYILVFYLRRLIERSRQHKLLYKLFIILGIAALSTLFESVFFGLRYSAVMELLPPYIHETLERPELVILPKGLNLLAGLLIIWILLRRWLPQEEQDRREALARTRSLESQVQERTAELEASNRQLSEELDERTRLTNALRESDARFRAVFEHAGLGVVIVDLDFKIVDCNDALIRMLGYSKDEIVALGIEGITHPDDLDADLALAESLRHGSHDSYQMDKRYVRKDGAIVWGSLTGTIVRDETGRPAFGIGMVEDITERRRAEDAVRESENLLRTFFNSSPFRMGVVEIEDHEVRFVNVNQAFAEAVGRDVTSVAGCTASELGFDRDEIDSWLTKYRRSIAENRSVRFESRRFISDHWETVLATIAPIDGASGTGPRLLFVVEDITQRKEAEDELAKQRGLMETIMQQAADAIVVCDNNGKIVFVNAAARRIARISDEQLDGELSPPIWGAAYDTDGKEIPLEKWSIPTALRGEEYRSQEARMVRSDGSYYDILVSSAPVKNADGDVIAAVATFTDITEHNRADEARRKLEGQMQHAQKLESLGVLAGGIAHDFNNLLVGILGNADLAISELPPRSPAVSYLQDVMKAAQRASDLSRQMLAYSGKGKFVVELVNVNEIIREMAHLLEVSISKSAVLRFNLSEPLPLVEADATQLRQIVMNLITNASDALEDNVGTIAISTAGVHCSQEDFAGSLTGEAPGAGDYVVLEVTDTGTGMEPETVARVFEPFFTTKFTGRGLGLAAVLGIVRSHGGTIEVSSTPGQGTVFSVFLPATQAPSTVSRAQDHDAQNCTFEGTVLLVDDEDAVRSVMARMLEQQGLEVVAASNGEQAVERFRERSGEFACVLLDLTMPGMDGEATFDALHAIRDDVPIVLTSGYSEQELTERFSARGFAGFLQKPFRREDLRNIVQAILG